LVSGIKSSIAGDLLVEAAFSAYCGWTCQSGQSHLKTPLTAANYRFEGFY
jgi:hypothetical protein